jgi:putative aldouronate transport system permease protein
MAGRMAPSRAAFLGLTYILLALLALLCLFPVLHVLAVSLSSSTPADAGDVSLWPLGFTLRSYGFIMERPEFGRSFLVSLERVALGVPINLALCLLLAYPLSRSLAQFRGRSVIAWFLVVTMLFSGGLIPLFIVVNRTGLMDTLWALVLPGAVQVFNVILLVNFFRELPRELEEAAWMDGAGHVTTLLRIFAPLSKPAVATIALFAIVGHWNAWFDGLIYMNSTDKYPLQSYLQTTVVAVDSRFFSEHDLDILRFVSDKTSRAAEIVIAMVPILAVYPFLQRYFTTGLVVGSVKG